MEVNLSIFRSYDIRGVYPQEINEETAYKIGRAFVEYTEAKRIIVGKDMRLSSDSLFDFLTKGITDQGADVFDVGQVITESIYFAVGSLDFDAGIMITASHNPKEYNGFKMIKKSSEGFSMVRGKDMLETIEKDFKDSSKGEIKKIDILEDYLNHIFSLVDVKNIKPLKVVIDAGNGMAGKIISLVQERLPINIVSLNFELDGSFPAHPSNFLGEGVTEQIKKKILKEKADLGLIFDGDADRIGLLDEKGELVKGDATLLLLAKYFLKINPGSAIVYNLICSKAVPEFIEKWGGKAIKTKVGFVNVREGLLENNGILGGELSTHYSFKDNFYGDSGFLAFLILLIIASQSDKKISETVKELSPYAKSSEVNFEVEDKEGIINRVKEKYSDGNQDYLDGVTVKYEDWWFNLRPSNTEPLLRLTLEADTDELLGEKKKELTALIEG